MKSKKPLNFAKAFSRTRVKVLKNETWATVKAALIVNAKAKHSERQM